MAIEIEARPFLQRSRPSFDERLFFGPQSRQTFDNRDQLSVIHANLSRFRPFFDLVAVLLHRCQNKNLTVDTETTPRGKCGSTNKFYSYKCRYSGGRKMSKKKTPSWYGVHGAPTIAARSKSILSS